MRNKIFILVATLFILIGKMNAQYCTNDSRYTEVQFFDSTEITVGANI
jgi:hypothetical protein